MNITYNYEVVSVDEAARCMEVVYTAAGHQTMHIGARLPYEGETLEAIVTAYAPVAFWNEKTLSVVAPSVGASGQIEFCEPIVEPTTELPASPEVV